MSSHKQPTIHPVTALPPTGQLLITVAAFVRNHLGDNHWRHIDPDIAKAIYACTKNAHTCAIQFENEEGFPLPTPLLWQHSAWIASTERWRIAKERDQREKIARWIKQENVARVKRAILKLALIKEDQAQSIAYKWIHQNKTDRIEQLCIKLATKEEDLS